LAAILLGGTPASAQGIFDMLFGGGDKPRHYVSPQANAYSNPHTQAPPSGYGGQSYAGSGTGRVVSYCVRLCDGRYFPMQRHASANPVQLCNAFCPAAKTQVFTGGDINYASAHNGGRYADLENAFVYRQKIVAGCTCNGRDPFGLVTLDAASDPTLRPGDIVATGDNVKQALAAAAANRQVRDTVTGKPALRGSISRRAATSAPVQPGLAADSEERPED